MNLGRHATRRTRLRLALLATIALLLQQLTFAAYACVPHAAPARAAMEHCEGMAMPAPTTDALCGHYCARPTTQVSDARAPSVPQAIVPPLAPVAALSLPLAHLAHSPAYCTTPHPSPPPATILYCTLQI